MNPNATLPRTQTPTPTRRRRTPLGLVFASVILGATLTACGSSPGDTTCGEYKDMSTEEQIDLIQEEVEDEGDDDEQQQFEDAPQEAKEAAAAAVASACDGEDDDTKLDDIE